MRCRFTFIAFISILLISCNDDDENYNPFKQQENYLIGSWVYNFDALTIREIPIVFTLNKNKTGFLYPVRRVYDDDLYELNNTIPITKFYIEKLYDHKLGVANELPMVVLEYGPKQNIEKIRFIIEYIDADSLVVRSFGTYKKVPSIKIKE